MERSSTRRARVMGLALTLCLASVPSYAKPSDCSDGLDNDHDGWIDSLDLGCALGAEALATGCNPQPDPANLVYNGHFECSSDGVAPDGWRALGIESPTARWGSPSSSEPWPSRVIETASSQPGVNSVYWRQIDATGTAARIPLKPNTWYELSVDLGAEATVGKLDSSQGDEMARSSFFNGILLDVRTEISDVSVFYVTVATLGPEFTDFDSSVQTWRQTVPSGLEPLQRRTTTFRTPAAFPGKEPLVATLRTNAYPAGILRVDNVSLVAVAGLDDPLAPPPATRGKLVFPQRAGADSFPIVLWGSPRLGGVPIYPQQPEWATFVGGDFDTHGYPSISLPAQAANLATWPDGLGLVFRLANPHWLSATSIQWRDDPTHSLAWTGPARNQYIFDQLADPANAIARKNLAMVLGADEPNCHPAEQAKTVTQQETSASPVASVRAALPGIPLVTNFCGSTYTGDERDLESYLRQTDAFSESANLPAAYEPYDTSRPRRLDTLGAKTRQNAEISQSVTSNGSPLPQLAFALGVPEWSRWDGSGGVPQEPAVPYNLQRFQIFSQIINGATGVWFHISDRIDLADPADLPFFAQVRSLARELASLRPVLLVSSFTRATTSDPRVETIIKRIGNVQYLIAASRHFQNLYGVSISVPGSPISQVIAVGEVVDGDYAAPFSRLVCQGSCNTFLDDFVGESANAPQGVATPGYAVHVYELP